MHPDKELEPSAGQNKRTMAKKKKKHHGHYCRICGNHLPNEKFTGKGHARHICKSCQSLPQEVQADMRRCNEVERAAFKYPMSRQDWELLEKYARKYKDMEDDMRYELEELLADNINEFMIHKDCIPEGKDLKRIREWVIKEAHDAFFIQVVPDTAYDNLVDETIRRLVKEWEEEGMEIKTKSTTL